MSKNERVIADPEAAGWEFDVDTGYWMWKGEEGTGGGLWEANGDDIYYDKGNVGIGETNPETNIDVRDATNAQLRLKVTGSSQFNFINNGTTADIGVTNSKGLTFSTGSNGDAERMRIDANGNVGIGESNPSKPLHITSDNNSGSSTLALLQNKGGGTGAEVELRLCPNNYPNDIGSTARWASIRAINTGAGNETSLSFLTNATSTDPEERVRIDAAGDTVFQGSVTVNGNRPVSTKADLITTLVTLRQATMDETQDIRESLRAAIDELVDGFEQEIAAMPAPEPEVSTQDLPE